MGNSTLCFSKIYKLKIKDRLNDHSTVLEILVIIAIFFYLDWILWVISIPENNHLLLFTKVSLGICRRMRPSWFLWEQSWNLPPSNSHLQSLNEHSPFRNDCSQRHYQLHNYFIWFFFHPKGNRRTVFPILSPTAFEPESSEMSWVCLRGAAPSQLFLHFPPNLSAPFWCTRQQL